MSVSSPLALLRVVRISSERWPRDTLATAENGSEAATWGAGETAALDEREENPRVRCC